MHATWACLIGKLSCGRRFSIQPVNFMDTVFSVACNEKLTTHSGTSAVRYAKYLEWRDADQSRFQELTSHFLLLTSRLFRCDLSVVFFTSHFSYFLLLTSYFLLLTSHFSLLVSHFSLLTSHFSLLTSHFSLLTSYFSLLTSHFLLLTSHFSLLILLLTSYFSLPTSHFSLLTSYVLLYSSGVAEPRTSHFLLCTSYFPPLQVWLRVVLLTSHFVLLTGAH